jgi:thiol:disulfide interchange protein DsbC
MKTRVLAAIVSLAALLALPSFAQDAAVDKTAEKVKAELKKKVPEAPVESVRRVPYGGLWEVIMGPDIYYTNEKAEFLVAGSIIDLKTKENITEARMRQVNAIKWDTLPLDNAIKIVRGNGSRKVAMFEDPNCGYCKRMERDILGLNDITVYVFLYPILSADSMEKSKQIWCSSDRAKTWIDHMARDAAVAGDSSCNTSALDKNLALGHEKRVQGTPTIIFENGERVPGAMPAAEFEKKLAESTQPPKPSSASAK